MPGSASAAGPKLDVSTPVAGLVDVGKIPVRAQLKVKRSLRVKRARFYIGNKLATTDQRFPFKIKRSARFDTRTLIDGRGTLKLTVRYEYKNKRGKLVRKSLIRRIALSTGGTVTGSGESDPGGPLPYDPSTLPPCPDGMLVCDEFDGTALDTRLWRDQRRTGPDSGAGNFPWFAWNASLEGAHYSPDNVVVSGGLLTMFVTDVESGQIPLSNETTHLRPKTTGSINTDGKFAFRYGTMEARIKVDACTLCWQSFWLHNSGLEKRPEFDVMEFMQWAGRSPYTVLHGLVGPAPVGGIQYGNVEQRLAGEGADLTGGWHTYRITRTPSLLKITIDNDQNRSCTSADPNLATDTYMFPILSMAIGDPERLASAGVPPSPAVPAGSKMQVDYVKIWRLGFGPDTPIEPTTTCPPRT